MKSSSSIIMSLQSDFKLNILIISTLAISVVFCAPQQQQQSSLLTPQVTKSSLSSSSQSSSQIKATSGASSAIAPNKHSSSSLTSNGLSSAASATSGSPSLVSTSNLKAAFNNDELDTFDGKNPFSDDSLWQIPVHLVRDSSANENSRPTSNQALNSDSMAKSASEKMTNQESSAIYNDNSNDDDDDYSISPASLPPQSASSSSPTVISASTDLKTAAGYHYPTHGGHHGFGHHGYGHGGHHGGHGDHYGGKYFQYASVPYPHAWEFGYRRGNPYHTIERYEHGKGPHFQTKVKWSDKHGGYGVHVWDYNHDDHHSHHYDSHGPSHYGGHHGHHGYGHGP